MTSDDLGLTQSPARAAEGDVREAFATGFITTQSGGGEKPFLKVTFPDLKTCQAAHRALLETLGYFGADERAVQAIIDTPDDVILAEAQPGDEDMVQRAYEKAKARAALSAEGSATIAAARLAAEEMRERAAKVAEDRAEELHRYHADTGVIIFGMVAKEVKDVAQAIRIRSLPPSSSPEDQEKAAATPTIADPDGESGR